MSGLPEVTMVGTLVADPEIRYTNSAIAVASATVACNSRRRNQTTGEWEDGEATFLRCSIWRELGEHAAESLSKGTRVIVTGRVRQKEFDTTDEAGNTTRRRTFEVDVTEIGPSLRWATATVSKARRTGTAGGTAWANPAPATTSAGSVDEPPF
ncbi:single-stranded DNA-binding protein [Salinifilum aidingensis]